MHGYDGMMSGGGMGWGMGMGGFGVVGLLVVLFVILGFAVIVRRGRNS
jgi:hypothetical protein